MMKGVPHNHLSIQSLANLARVDCKKVHVARSGKDKTKVILAFSLTREMETMKKGIHTQSPHHTCSAVYPESLASSP